MANFSSNIHPTAVIANSAKIAASASIGPYCIIGAEVEIGENVVLKSHVNVDGITSIGEGTIVFPFASLGTEPQDLKYAGEKSRLIIGKNNKIREYANMNTGTKDGAMETRVGDNCLFMMSAHVAHDCVVGNNVIMANCASIAGHAQVGDNAILGGFSAVHQFVRIGAYAMIGGMSGIDNDVIPFGLAMGERASLTGLNLVGMRRRGLARDEIADIRSAYDQLFADENSAEISFAERLQNLKQNFSNSTKVAEIIQFLEKDTSRAICKPKQK